MEGGVERLVVVVEDDLLGAVPAAHEDGGREPLGLLLAAAERRNGLGHALRRLQRTMDGSRLANQRMAMMAFGGGGRTQAQATPFSVLARQVLWSLMSVQTPSAGQEQFGF